jgi:hypothetical protein
MNDLDQMSLGALEDWLKRLGYPLVTVRYEGCRYDDPYGGGILNRCSVIVHDSSVGAASGKDKVLSVALGKALERFQELRRTTCFYCLRPKADHPHSQCVGEGPGRFTSLEDRAR